MTIQNVAHRTVTIDGLDIFYREAGPKDAPTILLLHGFPTSSHMFRNLIPALADEFHLVAPDYPGFGHSSALPVDQFDYTFDKLADVVETATAAFEKYDHARALQVTESFFWSFTDDYVELIKDRAYGAAGQAEQDSVLATLATTLDALLRLFAPFLPFATEEVWSWWRAGSVHRAEWPTTAGLASVASAADKGLLGTVGLALGGIRKAKSEAKVKQRTEVLTATISGSAAQVAQLEAGLGDLKAAGNAREVMLAEAEGELTVTKVELAAAEAAAE